MINYDCIKREIAEEHNSIWPRIPDHPYKISIIGGSGSGKTNLILKLKKQQDGDN